MQETEFISQNKEKWKELEGILNSTNKDPDRLTTLFIETTDDLSYSRTFYPNRSVRVYLNSITQKVYNLIYRKNKKGKNAFASYVTHELPSALYHTQQSLLLSFLIFTIGIIIGVFSDIYYPGFAKIVLSEYYVEMTESFIEEGDPMKVYKNENAISMFFSIAINNIQISFGIFVLGLLWGVGTTYILLSNGVMFGAFMHFFFARNLGEESFLTVMQHGTLELSMIVLSGSAGLVLSRSILFPGTYSRLESLVMASSKAIRIMIAVFILLLYAALIESFLTRFTEIPNSIRVFSISLSTTLVIGYFVMYPVYQKIKGRIIPDEPEEVPFLRPQPIALRKIKSSGVLFNETLQLFGRTASKLSRSSLLVACILTSIVGFIIEGKFSNIYQFNEFEFSALSIMWAWFPYQFLLDDQNVPHLFLILLVGFFIISIIAFIVFKSSLQIKTSFGITPVISIIAIGSIALLPLLFSAPITFFALLIWWPFCMLWLGNSVMNNTLFISSLSSSLSLYFFGFLRVMALFFTVHGIQYIILLTMNGALLQVFGLLFTGKSISILGLIFQFIGINIPKTLPLAAEVPFIIYTFLLFFALALVIPFSIISSSLLYHTLKESQDASELKESISKIGSKKRAYGLEKES